MHPHNEHRAHKVEHRRVSHITKGYANGGAVHGDAAADLKLLKSHVHRTALDMDGRKPKHRADRPQRAKGGRVEKERHTKDDLQPFEGAPDQRAKGGRVKHKGGKTVINIMNANPAGAGAGVAPGGAAPPMLPRAPLPVAAPPAAPAALPSMPPRPPVAAGAGPMIGPRQDGGRTYASGGRVKDGPAYMEGKNARPVDHAPGKWNTKDIGRGRVITYASGGAVEAPHTKAGSGGIEHPMRGGPKMSGGNEPPTRMKHSGGTEAKQGLAQRYGGGNESTHSYKEASLLPGGGKGGLARIYKAHRYAKMA
jgi:hypothetical protein